jgi:hypothetical protein
MLYVLAVNTYTLMTIQIQQILIELRDATGFNEGCWEERARKGTALVEEQHVGYSDDGGAVSKTTISHHAPLREIFICEIAVHLSPPHIPLPTVQL